MQYSWLNGRREKEAVLENEALAGY